MKASKTSAYEEFLTFDPKNRYAYGVLDICNRFHSVCSGGGDLIPPHLMRPCLDFLIWKNANWEEREISRYPGMTRIEKEALYSYDVGVRQLICKTITIVKNNTVWSHMTRWNEEYIKEYIEKHKEELFRETPAQRSARKRGM